jgi:hypothetical protein
VFQTLQWTFGLFEEKRIGFVPKSLQNEYLDPLRKVKGIARAFTMLENQEIPHALSDLYAFLTCTRIASCISAQRSIKGIWESCSKLETAKVKCGIILDALLGSKDTLRKDQNFDAAVHNFKELKAWWKTNHIDRRSTAVCTESADWGVVKDAVETYRSKNLLADIESRARLVVEDSSQRAALELQRRRFELEDTP